MTSQVQTLRGAVLASLVLPAVLLFVSGAEPLAQNGDKTTGPSGTLEKLVAARGDVTITLDAARFGDAAATNKMLKFQVAPESFFTALVFNDTFRTAEAGALTLVAAKDTAAPAAIAGSVGQLMLEKLQPGERFEYALRDAQSGFVYFHVDRFEYSYAAANRTLQLHNARLVFAPEFAKRMGHEADAEAGSIAFSVAMFPIEVTQVVNGELQSATLPSRAASGEAGTTPGPDVIVGDIPAVAQMAAGVVNGRVGLAVATTSCNAGVVNLNWFANPSNDHPVIPQNLYRMSGGADNAERFEHVGQSWMKHAFTALTQNVCNLGCNGVGGSRLGSGCSDPYSTGLNGSQTGIGSRAWANPFTGFYPRNDSSTPNNTHSGHSHDITTHRLLVDVNDLNTTMNAGAAYFAEAQYVTPHEWAWCQSNPGECNMYNNVSYRRFNVSGTTQFSFTPAAATVRERPAVFAWTGATIRRIEPAPGADGHGFVAYKVSGPTNGLYHYEYVVFNENLDRAIQAFSVPTACGVQLSNVGFKAPPNHPGSANDGTLNSAGFSNAAWSTQQSSNAMSWTTETFAQNQNANAIRWGTAYTFRFDSAQAPTTGEATIDFFKAGQPITVAVEVPGTPCAPLQLASVVSRKPHGSEGEFDVDMPLGGGGVEPRNSAGKHTLVFTFNNPIASGSASASGATVSGTSFSDNTMTVDLSGVADATRATVSVSQVTDSFGQTMPDTSVIAAFLVGDVNGDSAINGADALITRNRSGETAAAATFRSDVNTDGAVSAGDVLVIRNRSGNALP